MSTVMAGVGKWDNLGLFASICWNIWKARNERVFQGSRQQEERICSRAVAEFNEYYQASMEMRTTNGTSQAEAALAWQLPPHWGY
ncbi:hypothetical protein RHMOL_Rhmol11G0118600 [Rhododendron molle]|uniref:Uncharacterized protein n=1 Tax=Rhododendron molle TaxID=49168 RepID=A0ACC0LR54_RHOML|nr:hypothetical protein RHMOL_Rhmol11G0118600 [Rhododendron molle]